MADNNRTERDPSAADTEGSLPDSNAAKKHRARKYIRPAVGIAILVAVILTLTLVLWDRIASLGTDEGRAQMMAWVNSLGFWGWLVTLGIQVLQIVVAILPGEPIELLLGFMWGPLWGTLTCLLGIFIGTALIFLLVRIFGRPFAELVVGDKDTRRYRFLNDPRKLDLTVFILFFVPGTPKDALTYLVPLTPMSPVKYFLIATLARIPSVVTSTVLGDSIMRGDYALAIAVFALTAVISVGGIIFGNAYVKRRSERASDADAADGNK